MAARARTKSTSSAEQPTDSVGRMLPVWKHELPELDLGTEGIVERIQKINKYIGRLLDETLVEFGLDHGEWALLMALRRGGKPYRLSPGVLARYLGLSAAAMTNRLNRLEERGLIRRMPDASDRRGVIVELTDAGWQAWQDSVGAQARKEALIAAALSETDKTELNALLVRLTLQIEHDTEAAGAK
jgi:DNA-binding MarR family transcriptional regulator